MRNTILFLIVLSLIGLGGCATIDPTNAGVHWKFPRDPTGPNIEYLVVEYKNDIYLRKQRQTPWSYDFEDRQLTHTLNVKETDVRVWDNGELTYFAHEPDGGHWYSQPLSGDDINRTRLDRAPGR